MRGRLGGSVVLVVAAAVVGTLVVSPVSAHIGTPGHLWKKHLLPMAKKTFFTKSQSDKRYVRATGEIRWPVFDGWVSGDPGSVEADYSGATTGFTGSSPNTVNAQLVPPVPATLFGKRLRLTGVEICYQVADPVYVDHVELFAYSSTEPGLSGGNPVVSDLTDRTEAECRTFTGTPRLLAQNGWIQLEVGLHMPDGEERSMWIQRTTFLLRPAS